MPDAPVAAPAAPASSAPAPSSSPAPAASTAAPESSTPAPASTGTPAPAGTSTPAGDPAVTNLGGGGVDVPADGSGAAAAAADPNAKVAPKPEDYGDDPDGYQEYLAAKWEFEAENGTLGQEAAAADAAKEEGVQEVVDAADQAAGAPAEDAEPKLMDDPAPAATPEALAEWTEKSPAFKAALDAEPALKESLFTMARENAKATPLLEIFPDAESARFANETAGTFVELQTGFQMAAEDPESFPQAFAKFEDLFRLRDANGEYVRDTAGNPVVGEDFNMLATHLVNGYHAGERTSFEQQAQQLQNKLDNAVYPNDAAKANDRAALERAEMAVAALRFVESLRDGDGEAKPDLSKIADPEVRAYYERKEKELEEQRKALGQDKTDAAKGNRKVARQQYETEFRGKFGGNVGKRIGEMVKEKLDAGTFIPSYVLEDRDPKTNAPVFAVRVLSEFEKKIKSVSSIRERQARLELLPPSQQAMEQRLQFHNEMIEQFLPGILDAEVRKVQAKEKADRSARGQQQQRRGDVAQMEPRTGGAPQPRVLNDDQILAQARETVKKLPGYDQMSDADRMTAELTEKYRLRGQPPAAR